MIYFDITDLIDYSKSNSHPTGIQRVCIQIIKSALESRSDIRCVFQDASQHRLLEFKPSSELFDGRNLTAFRYLHSQSTPKFFPEKHEIKSYLQPYENQKIIRGIKKAGVHLTALTSRRALIELGFTTGRARHQNPQTTYQVVKPVTGLLEKHTLVILGAFWTSNNISGFAAARKQQGARNIVLIHDIIPIVTPQFCGKGHQEEFKITIRTLPKIATNLLCVSEWTARDIRTHLRGGAGGMPIETLRLAHELPGVARHTTLKHAPVQTPPPTAEHPYILCVGTIEARKNPTLLIRAWDQLIETMGERTPHIVFAGKWGDQSGEFNAALRQHNKVQPFVRVVASASDDELASLYIGALMTVFPSHYEGWGLPVGEAAWLGKYCVASSSSSIPEVVGDLADYAAPEDLAGFFELLRKGIVDHDYREAKEHSIKTAPLRTWCDVANQLLKSADGLN
jgi:glycosyltransferase involved in cell wall biosynthesis